jgi:tetratricopeptide (TPR) repeat protein
MRIPDWRNLVLNEGIVPEPTPDAGRIVLWLPGSRGDGFQHWERVSSMARAEVAVKQGLGATPAVSVPVRQAVRGIFGKLFRGFRRAAEGQAWTLPNGEAAEQSGERRSDLILVWAEDETNSLDETRVRSLWPEGKGFQQLGKNLFLVSGIELPAAGGGAEPAPPEGCPRAAAEQLLAAARGSGDRRREATALTDLGIIHRQEGDAKRAAALLEEALPITRELGDRSGERDVLGQLGMATLVLGQARRALELLEQALLYARAEGDRFAEKAALDHLGLAHSRVRDPARAIPLFTQALTLARDVGDRKHEAELLWYLAIQHAELGQREQALAHAQAAVDFLTATGKPQAAWFAHHLQRYRTGATGAGLGETSEPDPAGSPEAFLGSVMSSFWATPAGPQATPQRTMGGSGLLRMALSAAKSMARFLGSGFKTATPATQQQRLRTCAACEHHTGVRCRLCGCFTNLKARMAHEECPIGKWPA